MIRRQYTLEEVRALPAVVPIAVADDVLGLGVTMAKALRATGRYPVRVLRLGRLLKVSTADLLTYLGAQPTQVPAPAAEGPRLRAIKGGDGGS